MKLKYLALVATAAVCSNVNAQTKAYFQQRVDHTIQVELDDKAHFLHGNMSMQYTNNSPDTLAYIYMHIYPNAYSVDNSAFSKQAVENGNKKHYLAPKSDWGYIDSLFFVQDGMPAKIVMTNDVDIIRILLPEAILPGESTTITTPFRVKVPKTFSRLGHEGNSYQISQWFPKPAVYDNNGWHPMPYLDQGEFYSEYGSYDVSITLPENYLVMATGNLQTASEQSWLEDRVKQAIVDSFKIKTNGNVPSSQNKKTIRFTEDNVHDFAWFADKEWLLRKDTVIMPHSNNITEVYVAYKGAHKYWYSAVEATKNAIKLYSHKVGPYPYKTVKVVEGPLKAGGGMEYPTVTVISPDNGAMNDVVIIHEVGHNWFYGILGSNERMAPWMDEGINSFYEKLVIDSFGNKHRNLEAELFDNRTYALSMATRNSQAIALPSEVYTNSAYGLDVYGKAPAYIKWLEAYMGKESFDAAMQAYYKTWQFKHPQAADFEKIFRAHTDKNLDWFFTTALHSDKPVDFAIKSVKKINNGREVLVKNKTGFYGPVALQIDSSATLYWTEAFTGSTKLAIPFDFDKVQIAHFIPDYKMSNNSNQSSFAIKPFFAFRQSVQNRMFVAPALAYNVYDRFMFGLSFHNIQLPEQSFQYFLAPMYSIKSNSLVGTGFVSKAFYPKNSNWLKELDVNVEAKRFSYRRTFLDDYDNPRQQFLKVAPELRFHFKEQNPRSPVSQYLSLKAYYIQEGKFRFDRDVNDSTMYHPSKDGYDVNYYGRIKYQYANKRTFNPYDITLEAQVGEQFAKFGLEANLKIDYFYKNKGIYLRVFGGKMLHFNGDNMANNRYSFAATYSGWNDYLYDQTFLGRNLQQSFASQQIYIKEGGFKMPTLMYANQIGISNDWMAALNINIDLPIGLPVQLYADLLTIADAKKVNPDGSQWLYNAGVAIKPFGIVDIYVPLLYSRAYKDYKNGVLGNNSFLKSITFKVDLDKIYWPRMQRQLLGL